MERTNDKKVPLDKYVICYIMDKAYEMGAYGVVDNTSRTCHFLCRYAREVRKRMKKELTEGRLYDKQIYITWVPEFSYRIAAHAPRWVWQLGLSGNAELVNKKIIEPRIWKRNVIERLVENRDYAALKYVSPNCLIHYAAKVGDPILCNLAYSQGANSLILAILGAAHGGNLIIFEIIEKYVHRELEFLSHYCDNIVTYYYSSIICYAIRSGCIYMKDIITKYMRLLCEVGAERALRLGHIASILGNACFSGNLEMFKFAIDLFISHIHLLCAKGIIGDRHFHRYSACYQKELMGQKCVTKCLDILFGDRKLWVIVLKSCFASRRSVEIYKFILRHCLCIRPRDIYRCGVKCGYAEIEQIVSSDLFPRTGMEFIAAIKRGDSDKCIEHIGRMQSGKGSSYYAYEAIWRVMKYGTTDTWIKVASHFRNFSIGSNNIDLAVHVNFPNLTNLSVLEEHLSNGFDKNYLWESTTISYISLGTDSARLLFRALKKHRIKMQGTIKKKDIKSLISIDSPLLFRCFEERGLVRMRGFKHPDTYDYVVDGLKKVMDEWQLL